MTVALIDYRAGNLTSVRKALRILGAHVETPEAPADLAAADAVIVPGVGHFQATAVLHDGWRQAIRRRIEAGAPLLGICLGMQWLFDGSEEAPDLTGLGLMTGRCSLLPAGGDEPGGERLKVPHVGWNSLERVGPSSSLLEAVETGSYVYFTHSYAVPVTRDCTAITVHGRPFAAVVERGLVCGVQFHPEKSGDVGLQILRCFLDRVNGSRS